MTDLPVKEWDEFVHDLVYENRFSSSHKVFNVIEDFSEKCLGIIKKTQVSYRARIYHQDPLREFLSNDFSNSAAENDSNTLNIGKYYNMQLAAMILAVYRNSSREKEIIRAYRKWKRKRVKGYDSSGSGAPSVDISSLGRLKPEKIRYLYLAEDTQTAAYEVRPTIGQHVSVATFRTMDEIRIYDSAGEIKQLDGEELDNSLFGEIQKRFSEPNTGDTFRYLPTQFLGKKIKQMGFDGLRFNSSLKNGGINVVLFDPKKCKPVRSDLIKVGDIELKFDNPDIYQLDDFLKSVT